MNHVFLFDMDGVLVNTEQAWDKHGKDFLPSLLGRNIAKKVGSTIGLSVNDVYIRAKTYGFSMDKQEYLNRYHIQAAYIYGKAKIVEDIDELISFLQKNKFRIGLVSASPQKWIEHVLPRLSFRERLEQIISTNDRSDLRPKPFPDGYMEAIRLLGGRPGSTIIVEDSNPGIQAAKSSGAFTIGFRQHLVDGYIQSGADTYAGSMSEIMNIVQSWLLGQIV